MWIQQEQIKLYISIIFVREPVDGMKYCMMMRYSFSRLTLKYPKDMM